MEEGGHVQNRCLALLSKSCEDNLDVISDVARSLLWDGLGVHLRCIMGAMTGSPMQSSMCQGTQQQP